MSTLKFKTSHATKCILMRERNLEASGFVVIFIRMLPPAKCIALSGTACFLPLPFKIITLMWAQNYILSSLNMAVISDSHCY